MCRHIPTCLATVCLYEKVQPTFDPLFRDPAFSLVSSVKSINGYVKKSCRGNRELSGEEGDPSLPGNVY